jgi:hypothetical protein
LLSEPIWSRKPTLGTPAFAKKPVSVDDRGLLGRVPAVVIQQSRSLAVLKSNAQ